MSAASNGRRRVGDWYPIHDWTIARVWQQIATARSHEAYAAGMSRLPCRFCIRPHESICAQRASTPTWLAVYAEVERRIGHRFRTDLTMAHVIAAAPNAGQLALIPLAVIV